MCSDHRLRNAFDKRVTEAKILEAVAAAKRLLHRAISQRVIKIARASLAPT